MNHWPSGSIDGSLKLNCDVAGDGAEVDEEGPTSEQLSDNVAAASSVLAARGGKVSPGQESRCLQVFTRAQPRCSASSPCC